MTDARPIKRRRSPSPLRLETLADRDFTPALRERALTGLALLVRQELNDRAAARGKGVA